MSSIYGNPPASAGIEYLSELRNQSQNEAVGPSASVPTNNKPRYERVYVLLASWADDSAYDEGLAEVGGAFEAALDGIVDKVAIPNKNASAVFNKNIMDVIHKAQSPGNHLVILYYQGGSKMLDGRFVLSKTAPINNIDQHIPWNGILQTLEAESIDTLILMACPYEGRKDGNAVSGCKEIIAASADTNADLEEHSPFSRAVAKALFQHMGKDLMTRELYDTLCSLGLRHRPIHIILSSHKEDPIMLGLTSPAKNNPRKSRPRQRGVKVDVVVERSPAASDQLVRMGAWMENTMSLRRLPGKTASSISDQLSISFSGTSSVANDSQRWGESTRKAPPIVKSALRNAQLQVTHEPASPPPEGRVSTTSFEIEDLVQSMNINMEIQNNLTRSGNYSSVSVLPIMFEAVEAELGLEADLESLRTCFLERFKFHVYDVFKIPSVNAESALLSRIINLTRDHGLKDDLIIVVYAGHGIDPSSLRREVGMPMGPAIWAPRGGSYPYELVDWSKIQQYLHHAQCDVLTILNCCYAGKTDLGNMNGTNEILAASDWDTMAWALDRSFLKVLVHELGKLANCKFSIDTLRHQLDIDNTIPGVKLINHPFHKRYPTADHPSILLQPLPTSGTVSRRATSSLQDMSIPCFYVRLTLDEAESLPKADWISFFATARFPSLVRNLHFYTQDSLMEQVCRDIAG